MYNHRIPHRTEYTHPNGKVYSRPPKDDYSCSTYSLTNRKFARQCSQHYIRTAVLRELALDAIRTVSGFVKRSEVEFIRQVREASTVRQEETAKAHRRRIAKEQKRVAELNTIIKKLYEDTATGKLSDKRFDLLSAEYEREQEELEQSIAALQAELDNFHADGERADKFIAIVKRYTDFTELTPSMITEFIEKIVVHEADKSSGEREQQVDIYLNFIGKFEVPAHDPHYDRKRFQRRGTGRGRSAAGEAGAAPEGPAPVLPKAAGAGQAGIGEGVGGETRPLFTIRAANVEKHGPLFHVQNRKENVPHGIHKNTGRENR